MKNKEWKKNKTSIFINLEYIHSIIIGKMESIRLKTPSTALSPDYDVDTGLYQVTPISSPIY